MECTERHVKFSRAAICYRSRFFAVVLEKPSGKHWGFVYSTPALGNHFPL